MCMRTFESMNVIVVCLFPRLRHACMYAYTVYIHESMKVYMYVYMHFCSYHFLPVCMYV